MRLPNQSFLCVRHLARADWKHDEFLRQAFSSGGEVWTATARHTQHRAGVLDHRGSELPRRGRGALRGGAEEDGVVLPLEDPPPDGPVLHVGEHLFERLALRQNQPQHQGSVPGRRWHGSWLEVSTGLFSFFPAHFIHPAT